MLLMLQHYLIDLVPEPIFFLNAGQMLPLEVLYQGSAWREMLSLGGFNSLRGLEISRK
jgi:hypothetical protein